jgi:hypothetical protein
MSMRGALKRLFLAPSTVRSVLIVFAVITALVVSALGYGRLQEHSARKLEARLGTNNPNEFFAERIRRGMTVSELARVVPAADRVNFLITPDGLIIQQFVYTRPLGADYQVNVIFEGKKILDTEFDERYLGYTDPISEAEAMKRLR